MNNAGNMITTTRDVDAILIPLGTPVTIPTGALVLITQELGGSYTVSVAGNLARVEGKDADALGLGLTTEQAVAAALAETGRQPAAEGPVDEQAVWEVLRTCYDPEIPVNIVDLGLVYDCHVVETDTGDNHVEIVMTLTAPGCGMGPFIVDDVRAKVLSVDNVSDVEVDLVFDPTWDRSMMSDEARLQLGMF
ncbi:MAG: putative Fe-S cluster assembly protein SufT [Zetaproteobacteria bacterium CG12_big_fil_rev_8_21_14_0_65_54_13]|nr:MAG: putative Fe-S cluster assembly protein SufT [Zetaproteobacteria bacterium CG23_combo_of_CG06-09_8_20_14_all_54_7]PIW47356.1 MAG: putative Fe-S cluster assembly protein SufT [Zetaproteobacteria bacterium CG12_big_fil_rev_8_21_14_0_65_54_13]PIX55131.1 MAG: putative Fe-S cluster assembly protein SufT [Zetaproteobacteria bacterium CG_4_10_14_3_um_filter_54_28]PJA30005.1 MAG: putative Fe-S cluster assembly protein SufT [Zetaproteobacteria bacterium CG_4_9_14_3_um_filter_54_145]